MRRVVAVIAFLSAVACRGKLTEYNGTAMDDTAPDSAAAVTLLLWVHTDTSFGGIVRVAAPLAGGGGAYAWHENGGLRVLTVSANGEETTLWSSWATDSALGGRYEVTRGLRKGHGGTWRAQLVSGPPANVRTLRSGARRLPLESLLVVALEIALLVAAARWIARAPRLNPVAYPAWVQRPSGIGGWLVLFVIQVCFAVLAMLARLPAALRLIDTAWYLGDAVTGYRALLTMEGTVHLMQIAVPILGLGLTFRRHRGAPRLWVAYLALVGGYALLDIIAGIRLRSVFQETLGSSGDTSTLSAANLRAMLFTVVWAAYWIRSERVRTTFGARALDPAPPLTGAPAASDTSSPEQTPPP